MGADPDLWLFFLVVLGVIVLPGMDMAYVLSSAITGGGAAGARAVAGIATGGVIHLVVGATGVATVLLVFPAVFNALLVIGAGYVAWLGLGLLRSKELVIPALASRATAPSDTFRRAVITSLLNPKAYAFVLAVYPAFLRSQRRSLLEQALALGAITALTQIVVYGGIALGAGSLSRWLATRPQASRWATSVVGISLIAAATLTISGAWRSSQ